MAKEMLFMMADPTPGVVGTGIVPVIAPRIVAAVDPLLPALHPSLPDEPGPMYIQKVFLFWESDPCYRFVYKAANRQLPYESRGLLVFSVSPVPAGFPMIPGCWEPSFLLGKSR